MHVESIEITLAQPTQTTTLRLRVDVMFQEHRAGEQRRERCRGTFRPASLISVGFTAYWAATGQRRSSTRYFIFLKRPPTLAARWITWVGLKRSKSAIVWEASLIHSVHQTLGAAKSPTGGPHLLNPQRATRRSGRVLGPQELQ